MSNETALSLVQSQVRRQKDLLADEIVEFVTEMQRREYPLVECLRITLGYKKGIRYVLTPKDAKEDIRDMAGWMLRIRDVPEYANAPEFQGEHSKYLNDYLFGVTVDGCIIDEYIWTVIGKTGYRIADLESLDSRQVEQNRWYLTQLREHIARNCQ